MIIKYLGGSNCLDDYYTEGNSYTLFTRSFSICRTSCDSEKFYDLNYADYLVYFIEIKEEEIDRVNKKQLRNEEIKKACDDLAELLIKKNNDYGDSFAQQYNKYGLVSALIRMDDKMRRLENLSKVGSAEVNESITDTLLDLSGYSLLSYVEAMKKSE